MRDLATYVHYDALYQAYLTACIYLLRLMNLKGEEMLNEGNPYKGLTKEDGFGTFGGPHILSLVCEVATRALKSIWYIKWYQHRRLRPEVLGGRIHLRKANTEIFRGIRPNDSSTKFASLIFLFDTSQRGDSGILVLKGSDIIAMNYNS
jgi:hypothetical protein